MVSAVRAARERLAPELSASTPIEKQEQEKKKL